MQLLSCLHQTLDVAIDIHDALADGLFAYLLVSEQFFKMQFVLFDQLDLEEVVVFNRVDVVE